MAADTFLLTLPDGTKVRCWTKDALRIREDIEIRGNVYLKRDPGSEVYERMRDDEIVPGNARRVDSRNGIFDGRRMP